MAEPVRLFTAGEVGEVLGESRHWVRKQQLSSVNAPPPSFEMRRTEGVMVALWTEADLERWKAFHRGATWVPKPDGYSDHNAVNQVGNLEVTWKLWWRPLPDGEVMWWFSTPRGWFVSIDNGRSWSDTDTLTRPGDYRYYHVNGNVTMQPSATKAVLRSAEALRMRLEG